MKNPATTEQEPNSGYLRLEQQIKWYDTKSKSAQRYYKYIKFFEIVCAALIPILAKVNTTATALLGAVVLVF
jgi:hypothetical protein